jgi:Galactosyltransferase
VKNSTAWSENDAKNWNVSDSPHLGPRNRVGRSSLCSYEKENKMSNETVFDEQEFAKTHPLSIAKLRTKQRAEKGLDSKELNDQIVLLCEKNHLHDSSCYDIPAELK